MIEETMTPESAWAEYWNRYQLATQAETAFTAETVRQFGPKQSGTMRYYPAGFDHATSLAAEVKHSADNAIHEALERARKFQVINPLP